MEIALFLSQDYRNELQIFSEHLERLKLLVIRFLVFSEDSNTSPSEYLSEAKELLRSVVPDAEFTVGTDASFAELNREFPDISGANTVTFSLNPQVHAFDNDTLMENCEGQFDAVKSAKVMARPKNIVVSPITLKPRGNPDATSVETNLSAHKLPDSADTRQRELFTAAWTVASLKNLIVAGAYSLTYFKIAGCEGVMEHSSGTEYPGLFNSKPGEFYPVAHILADLREMSGGIVRKSCSTNRLKIAVLEMGVVQNVALIANLTSQEQKVNLEFSEKYSNEKLAVSTVRTLSDETIELARQNPKAFRNSSVKVDLSKIENRELVLTPYAVVRLDIGVISSE